MSTPRSLVPSFTVEQIDEHITNSDARADILNTQSVDHASAKPLLRYQAVAKKSLTQVQKIKIIKQMMTEDDLKNADNEDTYKQIFYYYPQYPRIPLELLKLFIKTGLLDSSVINSLLVSTLDHHQPGGPLYLYIEFLIRYGANPNYINENPAINPMRLTALHYALLNEQDDVVDLIFRFKMVAIDYRLQDSQGRTVLILAAKMRKNQLLTTMLSDDNAKNALCITDNEKRNILHYSFLLGSVLLSSQIIDLKRINITDRDIYGYDCKDLLRVSAKEIVRVLNSVGIDENRHIAANKNYFLLTPNMPILLPLADQLERNLDLIKFDAAGNRLPEHTSQTRNLMVPILNCFNNVSYIQRYRARLIENFAAFLTTEIKRLWDSQKIYLQSLTPSLKDGLLATCISGRQMIATQIAKPSMFASFSIFKPTMAIIRETEEKSTATSAYTVFSPPNELGTAQVETQPHKRFKKG